MSRLKIDLIPEPTRFFKIGDEVSVGALKDCVVKDILHDGKVYVIDYTQFNNNYGRPILTPHSSGEWKWLDIFPRTNESSGFIKNDDIDVRYSQRMMDAIFSAKYSFGIDMEPEYQRGYVWSLEDKQALIDSIYNNVDIGKFTFVRNDCSNETLYEVLDGKQRINAICDFYEGKFKYNGLFFHEIGVRDRDHFENYTVNFGEIDGNVSMLDKLRIFKLINTTGKSMDKEHLKSLDEKIKELEEQ